MLIEMVPEGSYLRNAGRTKGWGLVSGSTFDGKSPYSLKAAHPYCEATPLFGQTSRWLHLCKLNQNPVWNVLCSKIANIEMEDE